MTKVFKMDKDAVDVSLIPQFILNTGDRIPAIGMGTLDLIDTRVEVLAESVRGGLRVVID